MSRRGRIDVAEGGAGAFSGQFWSCSPVALADIAWRLTKTSPGKGAGHLRLWVLDSQPQRPGSAAEDAAKDLGRRRCRTSQALGLGQPAPKARVSGRRCRERPGPSQVPDFRRAREPCLRFPLAALSRRDPDAEHFRIRRASPGQGATLFVVPRRSSMAVATWTVGLRDTVAERQLLIWPPAIDR